MKVADVMDRDVEVISAEATVEQALEKMTSLGLDMLPVLEGCVLVGMLTAGDLGDSVSVGSTNPCGVKVRQVMTRYVPCCFSDEDVKGIVPVMQRRKASHLMVMNRDDEVVGIISSADLTHSADVDEDGRASPASPGTGHKTVGPGVSGPVSRRSRAMTEKESRNGRSKRILVADDDLDLLTALSTRLKKEGFEVITTADGYQTFTYTSNLKPDAVILDINMPCGDGFSVHQRLRNNMLLLAIPIIYLTGEKSTRVYQLAAKMNAFAVITKPFDTEELLSTVRKAVGISRDELQPFVPWGPQWAPSNN